MVSEKKKKNQMNKIRNREIKPATTEINKPGDNNMNKICQQTWQPRRNGQMSRNMQSTNIESKGTIWRDDQQW